jgi:hypothetical protein
MYLPVATPRELEVALEYAGFTEILVEFHPPHQHIHHRHPDGDGYWAVICYREGTLESVRRDIATILDDFRLHEAYGMPMSVYEWNPEKVMLRSITFYLEGHTLEGEASEAAKAIVATLLEDIDADLPSHKSEVRILPTSDPRRFDVTLLTGFDPVYIGTLGHQGSLWKPVEVMPGIGREMRAKLHFVGPDKESVAMTLVQALKPFWKRKIAGHLTDQMESVEEIAKEAAKAEKPASPEQAEAGNYRKGHVSLQGLEIAIENAEGSTRSGTGKDGKTWTVTMPAHYGYIKGTKGKDKDHLDVYIGPKPEGMMVFVVNQQKEDTKAFDEHKIMLGFVTKDDAIATYDRAFSGTLGPKLRQSVVSTTVDKLKAWLASGNTKKPFDGIVEGLLEADEENGFDALKRLALRAGQGAAPGTQFHIGFAISTSDEHMIEMRANDDAAEVDWAAINDAIPIIEKNAITVLGEQGIQCRSEGHDSHGDLVGSAWVEAGTGGVRIVQMFIDAGEPFRTSSGTIDFIQQGFALRLYQGVSSEIASLIDVDISFFDLDKMQNPDPLAESEPDMKSLAMRTPMRDPQVWGELKVGDVLYVPETGCYERIDALKDGYGSSYQGADGKMVYNSAPAQFRLYSQFGPAYAYGHFVQHLSAHPKEGLFGAQLVELPDTSDAALWKLMDEEMYRNGTTPEELEQSRADHRARQAARRPEEVDAQRRYDELMGRVPEPPVDESEEIDPKAFAQRATAGLSPDTMVKFQCPFTTEGQQERPYYFSDDLGDWASPEDGGWDRAEAFRLGDYIHGGVVDVNDFPFGTESVIVVNPDGSPGPEISLGELDSFTATVIDTYVSPDHDNEAERDANPGDYFPRA